MPMFLLICDIDADKVTICPRNRSARKVVAPLKQQHRPVMTVTLNPCVDRTVWVDTMRPGELHRVAESRLDFSGKGINVAKALTVWGWKAYAIAVAAGETGERMERHLKEEGVIPRFVYVPGETRTNIKVIETSTHRMTELNEPGVSVDDDTVRQLEHRLEMWIEKYVPGFLVFSGSLPPGVCASVYGSWIRRFRARVPVLLDSGGEALALGVREKPHIIKPNLVEMEGLVGKTLSTVKDWVAACREVKRSGVGRVVLSLGEKGALFAGMGDEGTYFARSAPVAVKSLAGCGDTMVAATIHGLMQGWPWMQTARVATAAATAAATLAGTTFPAWEHVIEMGEKIHVEKLPD